MGNVVNPPTEAAKTNAAKIQDRGPDEGWESRDKTHEVSIASGE
jgi:hypothetical protein